MNDARGDRLPAERGSFRRYAWYGLLAATTVTLVAASAASAVVGAFRARNALTTLRISPGDPVALTKSVDLQLNSGDLAMVNSGEAGRLAKLALTSSPINPAALRLLAIEAEMAGKPKRATELLIQGEQLSRRDMGTQMLLLEKSVQLDDVRQTLVHYDRLLRTNATAGELLFPLLNGAAAEPRVSRDLAALLRTEPPWLGGFLDWVIFNAPAVDNLGGVLLAVPARTAVWTADRKRALVTKFVSAGQLDSAFRLYHAYSGNQSTPALRDGRFQRPSRFPPIEWDAASTPDLEAALSDGAGGLVWRASTGVGGTVATQLLALKPGRYEFTAATQIDQGFDPKNAPRWSILCWGEGGASLLGLDSPQGLSKGVLTVPATGCQYQWLRLDLRAVDAASGQNGTVREVTLRPVPGS